MKAVSFFLVFALLVSGADAFTTKKREKRPAFQSAAVFADSKEPKDDSNTAVQNTSSNSPTAAFALPPSTMASSVPVVQQEETDDEMDDDRDYIF